MPLSSGALAALAILIVHPFRAIAEPGTLEVTTIDVGQGDSILVSFPDGKLVLMDTGGLLELNGQHANLDIGEDVVAPYLWTRGIHHLDVVAISHFHDDHSGGLKAILKDFAVTELWTGAVPAIYKLPENIPIRKLLRGDPFAFGGASVQVLAPSASYTPKKTPTNNDSLVLRLKHGRHSFLLTGDAEKQVEAQLLNTPRTDVLKVGHHGSKTSSTPAFLDALRPAFALISDGWENRFNHPASENSDSVRGAPHCCLPHRSGRSDHRTKRRPLPYSKSRSPSSSPSSAASGPAALAFSITIRASSAWLSGTCT